MEAFRLYILSLMKDKRRGPFDVFVKGILRFLSWGYLFAIKIVDWAYFYGIRRVHKVDIPVISVGNITLGGTGKTPFSIFLAEYFLSVNKLPAILTRGYGRDECRMITDEVPNVPVFVGQDRLKSAESARLSKRDVLILDDAFQHRRIAREINILLLDASSIFGNGRLFPRGILREPASSCRRADLFVVTKADAVKEDKKKEIIKDLNDLAPGKDIVFARHKVSFFSDVTGAAYAPEAFRAKRVVLASGIADPDYFAFLVESSGAVIAGRHDFSDHYQYSNKDIAHLAAEAAKVKAEGIIMTKKDFIKIKKLDISSIEDKIFVLNILMEITEGKEKLLAGLNSISSR